MAEIMDDEIPPPSSPRAGTIPSSPPLDPRYRALSPTSSEPPLFSSDDPPEAIDVGNYESPRYKRKRVGPWFEIDSSQPAPERKKSKMTRNYDSGIWMQSDASSDPPDAMAYQPPSSSATAAAQDMSPEERQMREKVAQGLERGSTVYSFESLGLEDTELHFIKDLNQVIRAPPDAGVEVPAEGQYRSMIPELYVSLAHNKLCRLYPSLFEIQHLTTLVLRNNQIQELPPQIGELRHLRELDLSRNALRWLPRNIELLFPPHGALTRLTLFSNPLVEHHELPIWLVESKRAQVEALKNVREAFSNRDQEMEHYYQHISNSTSPEWMICRIRLLENVGLMPREGQPFFRTWGPQLVSVARTMVTYYDQAGQILKGSFLPPESGKDSFDVLIDTSRGTFGTPSRWFEPSSRAKPPSLLQLSLNAALGEKNPDEIREMLDYNVPRDAEAVLTAAEANMSSVFDMFRTCHVCQKRYIMPAAEWLEFWSHDFVEIFPVKTRVCSWACVPEEFAKEPIALRW